ncbi:MAG: hypothetical protein MRJ92_09905 [Nitrospira sp.]|nr:hypothetical protein [Nitrospira sp.]
MPVTEALGTIGRVFVRCLTAAAGAWLLSAVSVGARRRCSISPSVPSMSMSCCASERFAPDDREIGVQLGITALRYGSVEVRTIYQFSGIHTHEFSTDQHSLFLNPRWNNFIDILDFPKHKPIDRLIRHVFGPLEDRAIPYIGALAGGVLPGPGNRAPGSV